MNKNSRKARKRGFESLIYSAWAWSELLQRQGFIEMIKLYFKNEYAILGKRNILMKQGGITC